MSTSISKLVVCTFLCILASSVSANIFDRSQTTLYTTQDNATLMNEWQKWQSSLPGTIRLHYTNLLQQLYVNNGMSLFWQDKQAIELFEQQLSEVALASLQPQFSSYVDILSNSGLPSQIKDMVLSDALLGYLAYLEGIPNYGRSWLYGEPPVGTLPPPSNKDIEAWQKAYHTHSLNGFIEQLVPQNIWYKPMQEELKKLIQYTVKDPNWPQLPNINLKPGDTSQAVPILRDILQRLQLLERDIEYAEKDLPTAILVRQRDIIDDSDNILEPLNQGIGRALSFSGQAEVYDPSLVNAVERFQKWHGLNADGVIGGQTRQWLNTTPEELVGILALNIQRLRLLPVEKINDAIMVNIPAYTLTYYRGGKIALESRVIVGSVKRKTPILQSRVSDVVLNPPWNVPTKILREDLIPKIKQDPTYLQKLNYAIYSGWGSDATEIDPSTIDWDTVSADDFPYQIRQAPGDDNALGFYKFNITNSNAIYLHDTPNHALFNQDLRALSSGCVRINKAAELAQILLNDVNWNNDRVAQTLQNGNTTYVKVQQYLPVELYYLTAWIGDNGVPQYRTDIYSYDITIKDDRSLIHNIANLLN